MRLVASGLVFMFAASMVFAGSQCVYDLDKEQCVAPAPAQNTILGQEPFNAVLLVLAFFLSILVLVSYFMAAHAVQARPYALETRRDFDFPVRAAKAKAVKSNKAGKRKR